MAGSSADKWAAWLLERRHGGDDAAYDRVLRHVGQFRDRVIQGARIGPGDVVLDVGCGDGLLGVAALDLVGPAGTVVFSDVSAELLDRCRGIAADLGAVDRCRFVHSGLPGLAGVDDASVDVVMTRSVLIYVDDKAASFATFRRLLRPGGRLSIFEPINRFGHPEPDGVLWGFDVTGLEELAGKFKAAYRRHQPDGDAMTGFDERDLFRLAEDAGFAEVHLEYRADVDRDPEPVDLATFLRVAPNPLVPTFGEILDEALTGAERAELERRMRAQLGPNVRYRRHAVAYLTARV